MVNVLHNDVIVTKNRSFDLFRLTISYLVQYLELFLHEIRDEMAKWRIILAVPYQEYLLGK